MVSGVNRFYCGQRNFSFLWLFGSVQFIAGQVLGKFWMSLIVAVLIGYSAPQACRFIKGFELVK